MTIDTGYFIAYVLFGYWVERYTIRTKYKIHDKTVYLYLFCYHLG